METVLPLRSSQPQLLSHDLPGGVVRQLEIVGAGHHAGQVVVRRHLRAVERLLDNRQRRRERLEAADGKSRTPGHELEEGSLVVLIVLRHDAEQVLDAVAVHSVAVVRLATLAQHLQHS